MKGFESKQAPRVMPCGSWPWFLAVQTTTRANQTNLSDLSLLVYGKKNSTLLLCSFLKLFTEAVIVFQVYIGGMHGDLCGTYMVGSVDKQGQRLLQSCQHSLDAAINICKPGVRFSWIGNTIE